MSALSMYPAALLLQAAPLDAASAASAPIPVDEGLTFAELVASIPFDPASLVAYVLIVGFAGGVVWFGTRTNTPSPRPTDAAHPEPGGQGPVAR
jgi:hypothetical protein